ncbi:MAG: shikimate kinase [Deltaproteobacteria bacterium]|nr:shikimate kinase [Deltaproteobacteria bacterium]
MNIVLIGYRGAGKSAVADILSARLQWPKYVVDKAIVEAAGMSIPRIVESRGWDFFRDLESRAVARVSGQDRTIIDTGGGVVIRAGNVEMLRRNGTLIWLRVDPKTVLNRIKDDTERPSLTGSKSFLEEIEEVLSERAPLYRSAADLVVDTNLLSSPAVAEKILGAVKDLL